MQATLFIISSLLSYESTVVHIDHISFIIFTFSLLKGVFKPIILFCAETPVCDIPEGTNWQFWTNPLLFFLVSVGPVYSVPVFTPSLMALVD